MKKVLVSIAMVLGLISALAYASSDTSESEDSHNSATQRLRDDDYPISRLISVKLGRTDGFFTKSPVFQRAIMRKPSKNTDTAILFYRGMPGIARIVTEFEFRRNLIAFLGANLDLLDEADIGLVVMDCPTDQWGRFGPVPTSCYDNYRSSSTHADDARVIMTRLREDYGITKFYVMGHSMGSISSRWLALNLGNEIAGSIHSASINVTTPDGYGSSVSMIKYDKITAPVLHIHHEQDACPSTPYTSVRGYAGNNLMTVRGGDPYGDRCEGGHYHSYLGMGRPVVQGIISWIKTKKVIPYLEQ